MASPCHPRPSDGRGAGGEGGLASSIAPYSLGHRCSPNRLVARHNFGNPSRSNQVVAMTLDNAGNIILAGTSANADGDFDYAVLKGSVPQIRMFLR
jgi:hypothetical protein